MSFSYEQSDSISRHVGPLEESSTRVSYQKPRLAISALAIFAMATVTLLPTSQTVPQGHRRLTHERGLSVMSRLKQAFDFIVGVSVEDDVQFGEDGNMVYTGDEGKCPGQNVYNGWYTEIPSIWVSDLGEFGIDDRVKGDFERTFEVQPNHTVLEDGKGVMFNVETVPDAFPEDLMKPRLTQMEILRSVEVEASRFYDLSKVVKAKQIPTSSSREGFEALNYSNSIVEAMSRTPTKDKEGGGIIFASGQGFLAACMTAFAYHLPLALTPDDIWTVIANGFARHVNANAEELRSNFVNHDGQKEIRIREDSMVKDQSPPEQWENLIFPKFSESIADNTNNPEAIDTLVFQNFTTSTVASQAASQILLMSTMKSFFKFQMDTMCGIPNVRLEGTRADWASLLERTKSLAHLMLQNNTHGDLWINDIVLPILDEFLRSYDGEVDYCFWQNMVKFRTTGGGSGSFDFLSGWLPTLFPYLSSLGGADRPNPYLRPWLESASAHRLGPQPSEIPIQLASAPVQWKYFNEEYAMHFHAGFRGVHQEADGTVRPIIGWYVTEDPR